MTALSRLGDTDQPGGRIMRGAGTVFANGIAVGLHVSPISPHYPGGVPHNNAVTTEGSPTVFAEGCAVLRVGSGNSCGHSIIQGSPDVNVP
jgi:uncharacterized Zn-binding protein involved in type VI secretion